MFGTRFSAAVAIALVGLLLPETGAASERPTLISHFTSPARCATCPRRPVMEESSRKRSGPISRRARFGTVVDPVVQTLSTTPGTAQALGQWEGLGVGYPGFS